MSKPDFNTQEMSINQTTVLPMIRGFGPLMAILFGPRIDLMRDSTDFHCTSILVGIGYDDENQCPYFEEHDMVFCVDTLFSDRDFEMVNVFISSALLNFPCLMDVYILSSIV